MPLNLWPFVYTAIKTNTVSCADQEKEQLVSVGSPNHSSRPTCLFKYHLNIKYLLHLKRELGQIKATSGPLKVHV